jgi:hypothetical protein
MWMKFEKKEFAVTGGLEAFEDGRAFCHKGVDLYSLEGFAAFWITLRASITLTPTDGAIIGRGNSSERALSGDETKTYHRNGTHYLHVSPFSVECVGVVPDEKVGYRLAVKRGVAYERITLLVAGVVLLFGAPRLARSVTLFYGAGITVGILASVLILLYMFGKFVPKKTSIVGLGILTGGYTLFASFFYWFWNHALEVAISNWQYVTAYIIVAALISFAVLYRMAPPTNERTLNLIQWTVQLGGVACIFLSFPMREVGVASVAITLLLYNFTGWCSIVFAPLFLVYRVLACILGPLFAPFACLFSPLIRCLSLLDPRHWTRPTRRFLTQQEYEEQGRVETKKSLEDLRKYCRHRDDGIWDKISNLHDSKRFASFLAGKAHISAQEQVDYEWQEGGDLDTTTSESEQEPSRDENTHSPSQSATHTPHRSGSTSRSTLSHSMNSSSDSPTFVRERRRHNSPHHHFTPPRAAHRFTSTPRSHSQSHY